MLCANIYQFIDGLAYSHDRGGIGVIRRAGSQGFIGSHASIGSHRGMAVGVIWYGWGVGVDCWAGDCVCFTCVAGVGVGVTVAFRVVLFAMFSRARYGLTETTVIGLAVGDGTGSGACWPKCIIARTASDDSRRMKMTNALRSILTRQLIIILPYIYKILYIKTIIG